MEVMRIPASERLSHAYIAASMNEGARQKLASTLAAAMLCEADAAQSKPCGHCRACRKTLSGIHPDIITISPGLDSQGRKRREMLVDQVRDIAATAQVVPNEGRCKVYVIEDADTMNTQAQNALLKLLEEPPESAAFVLCVSNPELLLPTVRSRCEIVRANADAEESDEAVADALELLSAVASDSRSKLLLWCVAHEGMDSRRCAAMLRAAREKLADVLLGKSEVSLSSGRCAYLDALFERCSNCLRQNVGVKSVMGLISVDGIEK
ncbi:MAG TPA: DNA polymerase III subunit [Candidatus Scatomorpha merdigallinarum]|nr:DNA polymerase III subunit [Candidatus Scatomorpha merdigallinarum]